MIGYITLGSNDLTASCAFYDNLLAAFGAERAYSLDNMVAYGFGDGRPMLVVTRPNDGLPASSGNGTMIALMASSKEQVDVVHARALHIGAADAGAPTAYDGQFYGGYFRDLDGNKLCVFIMQQA